MRRRRGCRRAEDDNSEAAHQRALIRWVRLHDAAWPGHILYAIPNGGHRHPAAARQFQLQGVAAGVPDLCLPVPRGGYAALYLELKRPASVGTRAGTLTVAQRAWHAALRAAGNAVVTCYGWPAAAETLSAYLAGKYDGRPAYGG